MAAARGFVKEISAWGSSWFIECAQFTASAHGQDERSSFNSLGVLKARQAYMGMKALARHGKAIVLQGKHTIKYAGHIITLTSEARLAWKARQANECMD
eukprot:1160323-Pelagomonas_calceolata.AAC.4